MSLLVPNPFKSVQRAGLGRVRMKFSSKHHPPKRFCLASTFRIFMIFLCSLRCGNFHLNSDSDIKASAAAPKPNFQKIPSVNKVKKWIILSLLCNIFILGLRSAQQDTNLLLLIQNSLKLVRRVRLGRVRKKGVRNIVCLSNAIQPQPLNRFSLFVFQKFLLQSVS